MTTLVVAPEYGYTVAVAAASIVLVTYFGARVGSYRKVAKVPLPFLYADAGECKEDPKKYIFNCYQRVHQNTLEGFSSYLLTLMVVGLKHPVTAASLGSVWCVGRVLYYIGYTSGQPAKRNIGALGHIGDIGLLGMMCKMGYDMIFSA
ncbi:Microsomal glutathione S-transferase 3 [Dissophora globulifera]|nr:Microsomal glutathione S-transferase 3 [Dissophora globulifera]